MLKLWLFALLCLTGCSSNSLEQYQYDGEALCKALVKELREIRTREELARELPRVKKGFEAITALIIEAKEYQRKHPGEEGSDPADFEHPYAEELKEELTRLCMLEGGRELIERAQKEALIRLDGFLKKR